VTPEVHAQLAHVGLLIGAALFLVWVIVMLLHAIATTRGARRW